MRVPIFLLVCIFIFSGKDLLAQDSLGTELTFIIDALPKSTPHDASLYMAGSIADWYPDIDNLKFQKQSDGTYLLNLRIQLDTFEYKITRGSWKAVEGRRNGRARPNRIYISGQDQPVIHIRVDTWEDISIGSYSIYMFFLIISSLQGLLLIVTINTIRNKNKRANSALTALLVLITFSLIGRASTFDPDVFNFQPKLLLAPELILFTYGPIFYYYIHKLLDIKFNKRLLLYQAILPLAQISIYIPFILLDNETFKFRVIDHVLFPYFAITGLLALVYNSIYWVLIKRILNRYRSQETLSESQQNYSQFLNWVLGIKAIYLILWAAVVGIYLTGWVSHTDLLSLAENMIDVLWLLFSFIIFALAYYAMKNPEVLREGKKQRDQSIPNDEMQEVQKKIKQLLDESKIYTRPDLTLTSLANLIPTSQHTLSRVINDHYKLSFSDLINNYRVKAFIETASASDQESFLAIAFQVGFNSKPTFNRAFKKVTGTTPRDYFKSSIPS